MVLCWILGSLEWRVVVKKRLIILGTRGTPARYGGFETLAEQLSRRLAGLLIGVQVPPTIGTGSVQRRLLTHRYFETALGTLRSLRRDQRHEDFAFLVVNPANVLIALRLIWAGRIVVIHMDGRDDLRGKWPLPVRLLYRCCQRLCVWSGIPLIFDSVAVRSEIGGRHAEQYAVIAYGGCQACEQNRMAWQASHSSQTFITLARAEPENQLVEIVRSVSAMVAPVPLRVVTTTRHKGRYWNSLVAEVNESGVAKLIDGIWDKEQLCSMYREVSAVIHGHTVGGTNPSLVLALCHGTPVFAHDNPYNREVAGSLARYWKDEQELTKLLDEFNPATWPYDQAAVDDFNHRYKWDDVVAKYKKVLGLEAPMNPEVPSK